MDDIEESFYAFRGKWLDYLVERRDLTHGDFRVAYFIASKINPKGTMWWNVKSIASEMGVSIATVSTATSRLQDAFLLTIAKGRKGSYSYEMRMPFDPAAAAWERTPEKRKKTGGRKRRVSISETGWVSKTET